MDETLNFAAQTARQAGELLKKYFLDPHLETQLKNDHTVVTEADRSADRMIHTAIETHFSSDLILSEELHPSYPKQDGSSSGAIWIVDPLDGTTNFTLGLHIWGVLLARIVEGEPQVAVSYFPVIDEMYTAIKGQGARLNGNPIQVDPPDPSRPAAFFSCCSRTHRKYTVKIPYKTRILGSAAYSFCAVARGTAVMGFEATPKIWDLSGGWLLVQEAGGFLGTLDGSQPFPLSAKVDYAVKSFPTIIASTPALIEQATRQIIPK
jgi:myo-inositol-1(or 4)-monophosphatase